MRCCTHGLRNSLATITPPPKVQPTFGAVLVLCAKRAKDVSRAQNAIISAGGYPSFPFPLANRGRETELENRIRLIKAILICRVFTT